MPLSDHLVRLGALFAAKDHSTEPTAVSPHKLNPDVLAADGLMVQASTDTPRTLLATLLVVLGVTILWYRRELIQWEAKVFLARLRHQFSLSLGL